MYRFTYKKIGGGTFGKVYCVRAVSNDQLVHEFALKHVRFIQDSVHANFVQADFEREIMILQIVSGHRCISSILGSWKVENEFGQIDMEYASGGDLLDYLLIKGPFNDCMHRAPSPTIRMKPTRCPVHR